MTTKPMTTSAMPMIVCPTTHNDWDWQYTFDGYYVTAPNNIGVRGILDSVVAIFAGTSSADQAFCFSYAELGFLRRYLTDPAAAATAAKLATLRAAGPRFCLLGGGITSPDNLVCDYEVFIRNYLTGHAFLRAVGLIDQLCPVGWIPDDFGHSPQLPILFEAMGMASAGLSRIPGSPQPALCPSSQPADQDVRAAGITFDWVARDGSQLLTQFMPSTYYGLTNYQGSTVSTMQQFLAQHGDDAWPGGIIFVTQGGDWQYPQSSAEPTTNYSYDWQPVIDTSSVTGGGVTATPIMGTFADYLQRMVQDRAPTVSDTLWAENYYTGHFASRPQLKIDHYRASRELVGAEVLASLIAMYGDAGLRADALHVAIADGWHLLVPTSHHDFVTGTSPDDIYDPTSNHAPGASQPTWDSNGQLAMSTQTVVLADRALALGLTTLAASVPMAATGDELAVVVFNQLGCDLPATAIVELADPSVGATDYEVWVDGQRGPVQRSSDGTLLFQVPGMTAMSYRVVQLVPIGPGTSTPPVTGITGSYPLDNGRVSLVADQAAAWAITSLMIGGQQFVPPGGGANQLALWTDSGNIYQFGMEFMNGCTTGSFEASTRHGISAGTGSLLEAGPVRWRFSGALTIAGASGQGHATTYDLVAGEPLVRITTTGAAPSNTSLLTSFYLRDANAGNPASKLEYGTAYHWDDRAPQGPSWGSLTFRASHDFAVMANDVTAVFGVYHNGVPAWTIDGIAASTPTLRGCLFRNTPGSQRAENGTDSATHTQHYTLDIGPQALPAATGYPLRTAQYAHTALHAQQITGPRVGALPPRAQLASVIQPNAMISVAKPAERAATDGSHGIVLRVQQATDAPQPLAISLPFLDHRQLVSAELVTALEQPAPRAPAVTVSGHVASFTADRALWTLRVDTTAK